MHIMYLKGPCYVRSLVRQGALIECGTRLAAGSQEEARSGEREEGEGSEEQSEREEGEETEAKGELSRGEVRESWLTSMFFLLQTGTVGVLDSY